MYEWRSHPNMQRQASWAGWRVLVEPNKNASLTCHENLKLAHITRPWKVNGDEHLHFSISLSECLGEAPGAMEGISVLFLWAFSKPLSPVWGVCMFCVCLTLMQRRFQSLQMSWDLGVKPFLGNEWGWLSVALLQNNWDFFLKRRKKKTSQGFYRHSFRLTCF